MTKSKVEMAPAEALVRLSLLDEKTKETVPFLKSQALGNITTDIRKAWIKTITTDLLNSTKAAAATNIRDWDLVLNLNGTLENIDLEPTGETTSLKVYPPCYRLPVEIVNHQTTPEDKIFRMESFALGGVLYEILMGKPAFCDSEKMDPIKTQIADGKFPGDVFQHTMAERMLVAWCPPFGQILLNKPITERISDFAGRNPWKFGASILGGVGAVVGLGVPLAIGAAGFGAGGVAAGSAAAGIQSGIGLVQAGSIFAWCQSVGAGGAALATLLGVGYSGVFMALGATLAGVFDSEKTLEDAEALKSKFLEAWKKDMLGEFVSKEELPKEEEVTKKEQVTKKEKVRSEL